MINEEYEFYGLWKQDLFSSEFWIACYTKDVPNKLGIVIPEQGTMVLQGGNFLLKKSVQKYVQDQFDKKILAEDGGYFDAAVKAYDETFKERVMQMTDLVKGEVSTEVLEKIFNELYVINSCWLLAASHLVLSAERLLQDQVVAEKFPAENVPSLLSPVNTPLTRFQGEVARLRKVLANRTLSAARSDVELWNDFRRVSLEYSWVETANFIGGALSPERLFDLVSHESKDGHNQATSVEISCAVSKTLAFRAKAMSQSGYMKQASAECFSIISRIAIPYLEKVAQKIGITYRDLITLRHHEVFGGLSGNISSKSLLEKAQSRKAMHWVIYTSKDNETVFSEDKHVVDELVRRLLPIADTKNVTSIKGQVANPGKVTGTVRVIMNTDEFGKMKPGDVLVTTMTTPDFVLLMQQSSAIVTDIGGLLCHAAIVGRELNKPCIIGTKIGTKVLKDGDMVEVDATKGLVTIIK